MKQLKKGLYVGNQGKNKMELNDDMVENLIKDFSKNRIHPVARAKVVTDYQKKREMTDREFQSHMSMNQKSLWRFKHLSKISEEEYDQMNDNGLNQKQILDLIANKDKMTDEILKKEYKSGQASITSITETDHFLEEIRISIRKHTKKLLGTPRTLELIKVVRNELNILEMRLENKLKEKR